MEAGSSRRAAGMVQQHLQLTFMEQGHALFAPIFYYTLALYVCSTVGLSIYAAEIFLFLEQGGVAACVGTGHL
jgi:hypothetical protein